MKNYRTEYIKQIRPLYRELENYGIKVNNKGFAHCPFHSEKTASFRVYEDGTFHCFGCGAHGDVIDFTMLIKNVDFKEACKILDGEIKYSQIRRVTKILHKKNSEKELLQKAITDYWDAFDDWRLNEMIFAAFKPKAPEDKPYEIWFESLSKRFFLSHRLDYAESVLLNLTAKEVTT